MKDMMSKLLTHTKCIIKAGWGLFVNVMSYWFRFVVMMSVLGIILHGLKPFATLMFLFAIGSVPDATGPVLLDTMGPVLASLALPLSITYIVIPFWGAWMVNRLMSKKHTAGIRTKIIFWLILVISVVGALFKSILSMSS